MPLTIEKKRAIVAAIIPLLKIIFDDSIDELIEVVMEQDKTLMALLNEAVLLENPKKRKRRIPRHRNFDEVLFPQFDDSTFKQRFRMERSTFRIVLKKLRPSLTRRLPGYRMIPAEKQLIIAIWKMTAGVSYPTICSEFAVSPDAALSSVRRVTKALADVSYKYIAWPTADEIVKISDSFEATSAFPKVIGVIDGTQINIATPKDNVELYINDKGHHSIQLQAVCDAQSKFIHCYTGQFGSRSDAHIFDLSDLSEDINDSETYPNDCHMLGDVAYELHEHLLTPYQDNGNLTEEQKNYNICHASARTAIERALRLLKCRFRSLHKVLEIRRTEMIAPYIMACCVLHNICITNHDELTIDIDIEAQDDRNDYGNEDVGDDSLQDDAAIAKRNAIAQKLSIRKLHN